MYHVLAYAASLADGTTATDITAPNDGEITIRNSHPILTKPFNCVGIHALGAGMVLPKFNVPSLNQLARNMIFPFNRSATVPSPTNFIDLRDMPMPLPLNEEIAIEGGNDSGGAAVQKVFLVIASPSWSRNQPRGLAKIVVRATAAAAGVADSWSLEGNLTFAENLKGGWYAVLNAYVFDAGTLAFRLIFPNGNIYGQTRLRPGGVCMEAIDNIPSAMNDGGWGVLGYFNSFEPPRIQVFANATGASAQEVRLLLAYLGENRPPEV